MPDILQISCLYNNEITSHYLSAGIRHNQSYFFTNEYTSIPNEYGLAPAYFPKMFFSEIVGYLNALLSDNSEDEDQKPFYPWLFSVTYRNGAHKRFGFSKEEVEKKAEKIMRLFHYNDFLDDYHNKLDDKKFLATDSSLITLQNVRGQISNRYVLLNQFFEQCSSAYGKADFNSANYSLSYGKDGSMLFALKKDATEKLTVKIDADGYIQSDGCIPYVGLLKEKGIRVISPRYDPRRDIMPFMTEEDFTKYQDPRFLCSSAYQSFSFENEHEYKTFLRYHQSIGRVEWDKGDGYSSLYTQAYDSVENGDYSVALWQLQDCLKLNPIAVSARFEMINCFLAMENYLEAKKCLVILSSLLTDDDDKAKLYRCFGYIFTAEKQYTVAYMCYRHSLTFVKDEYAITQMIHVEKMETEVNSKTPFKRYDVEWREKIEEGLDHYRIPVLSRY